MTNADLDHVLGLFSLREGTGFRIFATTAVKATVEQALGLDTVLSCFSEPRWEEPMFGDFVPLGEDPASSSGLFYRAIALAGKAPPFSTGSTGESGHSVAYEFMDGQTKKRLVIAPDVAAVNSPLQEALKSADAVLFDGTFWSPDELAAIRPGAKRASDMGHLTIRDSSMELLGALEASKKIYIHINNTNPVLVPGSPERLAVERAGLLVGEDGMEFEL